MRLNLLKDSYFICAIAVPLALLFFLSNGIEEIAIPVVVFNRDLLPPPITSLSVSERQAGIIAVITAAVTALVAAATAIATSPLLVALTPLLIVVWQVLEFIGCVGVAFAAYFGQCRLSTGRMVYDNDFEPYFDGFRSANSSEIVQFLEQISNVVKIVGCPVIRLANAFCIATDPVNWVIPILQVVGCVGIVTASTAGHCKLNSSRIINNEEDEFNKKISSLGLIVDSNQYTVSDNNYNNYDDEVQTIDFSRVNWFNNDGTSNNSNNVSEIIQKIENYTCPIFAFAEKLCAISNPIATSVTQIVVPILESIGCIGVKVAVLLGHCSSSNRMLIPHYVGGSVQSLRYGQIGGIITDSISGLGNITCSLFETLNEVCINFGPSVKSSVKSSSFG